MIGNNNHAAVKKRWGLKEKLIPPLVVFLVIAITLALFFYRDKLQALGNYGYLGAFLVCLISNASIFLPMPGIVVLFALGTVLNPVLVALAGASGGIIGEITGFVAGYSGRRIVQDSRMFTRAQGWMRRWGSWAVFAFAVVPLPVLDIAGVVAGVLGFPIWKFLLVAWVGKSIKYIGLVVAGAWGWETVLRFFG